MKTFLVTGATGFLGCHLVEALLQESAYSIRILSRSRNPWEGNSRVQAFTGDILDPRAVDRASGGVSGIFHLAGFVTRDPSRAAELFDTHIRGTRNICESALAHGNPKIVLSSSSGTIAASRDPRIHTEESPYANETVARWPYYLSKIHQEKLALHYHARGKLPVVVVCPSLLLGPGDRRSSSTGDIRMFLQRKLTNNPTGGLNFVDVRDAAGALVGAMGAGAPGRRYLVGGHNMSVVEFFKLIENISGVRAPRLSLPEAWSRRGGRLLRFIYGSLGGHFPLDDVTIEMAYRFWYLDNTRAQAELGLKVRPAEMTIRDTVEYLRGRSAFDLSTGSPARARELFDSGELERSGHR